MSKLSKLDKFFNELEKAFGRYLWIEEDYADPDYEDVDDGDIVLIQVADCMAEECEEIIAKYGYEILDDSDFCGSSFDGVNFVIKTGETA